MYHNDSFLHFLEVILKLFKNKKILLKIILTRNTAIDIPTRKPAITSDQ